MTVEINALIANLIAQKLRVGLAEVTPQAHLVEALGADSLNILEIVLDINEALDIEVSADGLAKVRRVDDLYRLAHQAMGGVTDQRHREEALL